MQLEAFLALVGERIRKARLVRRLTQEQAAAQQEKLTQAAIAAVEKPTTEPPRAAGMSIKPVRKFRVTDIHALYKAKPDLVELSPKTSAINAIIRSTDEIVAIPGIEQYADMDVSAKAT